MFVAPVRVCRSAAFVEFVLRVLKDKTYVKVRVLVFDEQVLFAVAQFKQSLCLDDDAVGQDEVGRVDVFARRDGVLYLSLLVDFFDALCLDLRGDVVLQSRAMSVGWAIAVPPTTQPSQNSSSPMSDTSRVVLLSSCGTRMKPSSSTKPREDADAVPLSLRSVICTPVRRRLMP